MKPNTALFICLFFSAIISIKASINSDTVSGTFQFIPSQTLLEFEENLPADQAEYIDVGKAKDTVLSVFRNKIHADMAETSFANTYEYWVQLTSGQEAPKVFGTFGKNFKKILTSENGANTIHKLVTIAHRLLSKSADDMRGQGLINVLITTYNLFTSAEMPQIVNSSGKLVIESANKPKSYECTVKFFSELKTLMNKSNLNEKLKNYFKNLKLMMEDVSRKEAIKKAKQSKNGNNTTDDTMDDTMDAEQ